RRLLHAFPTRRSSDLNLTHEDLKADYRAELGNLASSGSETLVVLAYASSSGQTLLRQALESGNFLTFVGGDGMVGDDLFTGVDRSEEHTSELQSRETL